MIKKIISVLIAAVILLSLAACGSGEANKPEEKKEAPSRVNLTKVFKYETLPEGYNKECDKPGTIEKTEYTATPYISGGEETEKKATVYLPYGYEDGNESYNILYLLHGAGGDEETYFGTAEKPTDLKFILDNAIANGDIDPLIVVAVTNSSDDSVDEDAAEEISNGFYKEVVNDIIPAIEAKYRTYAYNDVSAENVKATRYNRAFGGFSMGSVSTWSVMEHAMDCFGYFLPMSGGSWTVKPGGDSKKSAETAEKLSEAIKEQGYGKNDFSAFIVTGSADGFGLMMERQVNKMKELTDSPFVFSETSFADGSCAFFKIDGYKHEHEATYEYIFNALHYFF